jgi:hypothetical protein
MGQAVTLARWIGSGRRPVTAGGVLREPGVNGRHGAEDLAVLIERSADLKRALVDFACSPRWERSLAVAMQEAGLEEIDEDDAIETIDRFALQYRLPDGQTVMQRPSELDEMMRGRE